MTANLRYTVDEQRRLLWNSRCLSAGSDSLYLQFKPTIWSQSYTRKHTNCNTTLQKRQFPISLRHAKTDEELCKGKVSTLPLQSSSLQPPKFNVDKPT